MAARTADRVFNVRSQAERQNKNLVSAACARFSWFKLLKARGKAGAKIPDPSTVFCTRMMLGRRDARVKQASRSLLA